VQRLETNNLRALVFSDNFAKFARQKWQTGFGVASGEFERMKTSHNDKQKWQPKGKELSNSSFPLERKVVRRDNYTIHLTKNWK
jgi:hypothetical protein